MKSIIADIKIISVFSINVASVMGKSRAEPRQAHLMERLANRVLVTPKVVSPNMTIVAIKAMDMLYLMRSITPNMVSINGYI